jgi:uncharacterized RDD family membrane protein YckC
VYQVPVDPTAVVWRRIGGWLIDFVFAGILFVVLLGATVEGYSDIPGNLCADPSQAEDPPICEEHLLGRDGYAVYDEATDTSMFFATDTPWLPLAGFVAYGIFSFVFVEGLAGASIGKLIVGLRVVKDDGSHAGIGRGALRFVLWIVDAFPYCIPFLVGLLTGATTKGHRRIGDMVAGTFVVSKQSVGRPLTIPGLTPTQPYGTAAPWPQPTVPGATAYGAQAYGTPSPYDSPAPYGSTTGYTGEPVGAIVDPPVDATPPPMGIVDAATPTDGPQWDPARNTYLQWDEARGWLQWDADANEWVPAQ